MKRAESTWSRWWGGPFLFLLIATLCLPAAAQQAPQSPGIPHSVSPPRPPKLPTSPHVIESASVALDLTVDGNQTVGGGIVVTFAVMAHQALDSVQIQLILPEGVQKTAGEPTWQGPMAAGEVRIVELSAELSAPGVQRIVGRATVPPDTVGGAPRLLTAEREWEVQPASPAKPHK
jgi:hypothetical protein